MKIINVVGARPNFIKVAPLMKEMRRYPQVLPVLIHTGALRRNDVGAIFRGTGDLVARFQPRCRIRGPRGSDGRWLEPILEKETPPNGS